MGYVAFPFLHFRNGEPVIFVYDGYEGGIGLAEKAFTLLPSLFFSA